MQGLSYAGRVARQDVSPETLVTPELVDRAVEAVLESFPEDVRDAHRRAWGNDDTGEVAQQLQAAIVAKSSLLKSYAGIVRQSVTVPYVLKEEQQRSLVRRYPDMDIKFKSTASHDHGLAAADRLLSSIRLHSKIPVGMRYVDFGGSVLMHVERGNVDVCVVGDLHDVKDPARAAMVDMRLKMIAKDPGSSENSRIMAQSILRNEGKYFQRGSLETFTGRFDAGVMSHVYDVPLKEIPAMMARCGMLLFECVMHYSDRFHFEEEGELESVGARFRVSKGRFEMGFVGSPAHWYGHEWGQFIAYGADQVIDAGDHRYSYKVTERRGDTISARILQVGGGARPNVLQHVVRPGVPMIEVSTYEFPTKADVELGRKFRTKRYYPVDIWENMVRSAMQDASNQQLDFRKHVRTYRNLVAGHKYNGVTAVTGTVPTTDVPWLVVDSAVYALTQILLLRREIKSFIATEMERRLVSEKWLPSVAISAFLQTLVTVTGLPLVPLEWLGEKSMRFFEKVVDGVISTAPVKQLVRLDAAVLDSSLSVRDTAQPEMLSLQEEAKRLLDIEEFAAAVLEEARKDKEQAPKEDAEVVHVAGERVDESVTAVASSSVTAYDIASGKPDWLPLSPPGSGVVERYLGSKVGHTPAQRREAVFEAVKVCAAEAQTLEVWCAEKYRKYALGRDPDAVEIGPISEANQDLDFWRVTEGVIGESVLGKAPEAFAAAGVYCPRPVEVMDDGVVRTTTLYPVVEATYDWKKTFRVHKVIQPEYTGWVLTCRALNVFNGRQVAAGLRASTTLAADYEMGAIIGGPGCGKSYSIAELYARGAMVVTPLRSSAADVRAALVKRKKLTERAAVRCVRTLDSILCEVGSGAGKERFNVPKAARVYVDECFNALAGKFYAVLSLLGAKEIIVYGDKLQIPPQVRAHIATMYGHIEPQHEIARDSVRRSVDVVLACFNGHYGDKLRTLNRENGEVKMIQGVDNFVKRSDDILYLCMNQADKHKIARLYPDAVGKVYTTNEAQGKDAEEVVLFNFEARKMNPENVMYLYFRPEYVNVAISRAKRFFTYAYTSPYEDLVKKWIERGRSPQLIAGGTDISTAGQPIKF